MPRSEHGFPSWTKTVGAMIAEEITVLATCDRCGGHRLADLEAIARKRGDNFSLLNQHPKCKTPGCTGRVSFRARCGVGTWGWLLVFD